MLFVGIDLGTSGCRAMAIDSDGHVISEARTALPTPIKDGAKYSQAPHLWWQGVSTTLDALLQNIDNTQFDRQQIKSIAVDGTSGTLLICDAQGEPIGDALMYNDGRATEQAQRVSMVAPVESAAHGATSALAKLLYLQPDDKARYALHQADWIVGRLTGQWGISDANNCLKLGYDAIQHCWPQWLLHLLEDAGVSPALLPKVYTPGTVITRASKSTAERFGLPGDVQVVAGTTDSTAAFIATGAQAVGEAVTSLGSTLVMKVISDKPLFSPQHGVYAQPLGDKWLVGGGSNSGGAVLLNFFTSEQMAEMAPQLKPDAPTELAYYPLLSAGERFPVCDANLQPRLSPRPQNDVDFFQAMLEGMAEIELNSYRLLESLGAPYPISIRSAGGGSHNPAWTAIRQQKLQTKFIQAQHQEAAYGSALLARKPFYK